MPFVYAYHSVGLDHQEFAPELETGDRPIGTAWVHRWTGERLVLPGGGNGGFLAAILALGAAETVVGLTDAFKPHPDKRGLYRPNRVCSPALVPGMPSPKAAARA